MPALPEDVRTLAANDPQAPTALKEKKLYLVRHDASYDVDSVAGAGLNNCHSMMYLQAEWLYEVRLHATPQPLACVCTKEIVTYSARSRKRIVCP
jgi:hypothetical protein